MTLLVEEVIDGSLCFIHVCMKVRGILLRRQVILVEDVGMGSQRKRRMKVQLKQMLCIKSLRAGVSHHAASTHQRSVT